jgi:hypothetical protein
MVTNRIPKQTLQYKPKGRDEGTNFILRIKEQETHVILHEHDDDDDDDDDEVRTFMSPTNKILKNARDTKLHKGTEEIRKKPNNFGFPNL